MNEDKIKIIIAEDEKIIALDLKNILQKAGYSVIAIVENLEQITAKINEIKPNLVLLDLNLDEKYEGLRVGNYLNKLDIPLIFITGASDQNIVSLTETIEWCDYIVKPFDDAKILAAVEKCVRTK